MPSAIAERASGHRASSDERCSERSSIQPMVPWWPAASQRSRSSPASPVASARVKPQAAKPSRSASARIASLRLWLLSTAPNYTFVRRFCRNFSASTGSARTVGGRPRGRGDRPGQGLRRHTRGRWDQPRGAGWLDLRDARSQRRGQNPFRGARRGLPLGEAPRGADELLAGHGLGEWARKPIRNLSKGMAQTVQLLGTIVHRPRLIVLDEPFSGLDAINQAKLEELIRAEARDGVTVIFSTHVIAHAERLCERIAIIVGGKLAFDGAVEEARDRLQPLVRMRTRSDDGPWRS